MISKVLLERIAADVSGDLSPTDAERLRQELVKSPEARKLHRFLEKDRDALRNLPQRNFGSELAPKVLAALAAQSPIIRLPENYSKAQLTRWPQVIGLCFGLALAFTTAWLISNRAGDQHAKVERDENPTVAANPPPNEKPDDVRLDVQPPTVVSDKPAPETEPDRVTPPTNPAITKPSDVLTAAPETLVNPVQVTKPRTSLPLASADLKVAASRAVFRNELMRERDHRLEFFSNDTNRVLDEFTKAARTRGLSFATEPAAAEMQKRKVKTGLAIYVETWSVDDLVAVSKSLAQGSTFQTLVLMPVTEGDRRELKVLLGRDPMDPASEQATKTDPRRPVADKTAEGLTKALDRAGKSSASVGGPVGYISLYPPPKHNGTTTKDQQLFWDRRTERLPGKLRVYLILRPLS